MEQLTIGIVASGPEEALPELSAYRNTVDVWIGADRGAIYLIESGLVLRIAVGDFDSVSAEEFELIKTKATELKRVPREKDETDLELALHYAIGLKPKKLLIFSATAGRKDHELINIQLLYRLLNKGIKSKVIDKQNIVTLVKPGSYSIEKESLYPYVSFIPFSERIEGLTLEGFIYPLDNADITWGSTRCISNELSMDNGNFSYRRGILMIIKSRDAD